MLPWNPGTRFVGPNPAAALMGLSASSVLRLIRSGELPAIRDGNRFLIPVEEIDRWADDRLGRASPPGNAAPRGDAAVLPDHRQRPEPPKSPGRVMGRGAAAIQSDSGRLVVGSRTRRRNSSSQASSSRANVISALRRPRSE